MSVSSWLVRTGLTFVFLGIVAVGADEVLTARIQHSESLAAGRIARLRGARDPQEIALFGSSKAESDYVPSILGKGVYNYGLAATGLNVTNWLLKIELRRQTRQPVIIDLVQWTVVEFGDPRNYIPGSRDRDIRQFLNESGQWRWYYAIPGLRYFGAWDWYVKGLISDRVSLTKRMDHGFSVNLDEPPWNREIFQTKVSERLALNYPFDIDDRQKVRLAGLIRSAPNRQFVLVLAPLHKAFFAHNDGSVALRRELREMQAELPNLHVIDMTHVDYPDSYYADTAHLNQAGAEVFSRQLHDRLVGLNLLR